MVKGNAMGIKCQSKEIALKSLFLGPQSENAVWFQSCISELLVKWFDWRQMRHVEDGRAISPSDQASNDFKQQRKVIHSQLTDLLNRFEEEVPKYSPRYVGHMFSEVALPAMLGHVAALIHNPNIISGESAKVGVQIEDEAIGALCEMIGFDSKTSTGHFTSGGTIANFEGVIRAKARLAQWMALSAAWSEYAHVRPDLCNDAMMGWDKYTDLLGEFQKVEANWQTKIESWNFEKIGFQKFAERAFQILNVTIQHPIMLVPSHKHYSWPKAASLFGFGDETLKLLHLDARGLIGVDHLRTRLLQAKASQHPIMMITTVAGTTELGGVDPISQVTQIIAEFGSIWHHVDAAYGGFFATIDSINYPDISVEFMDNMKAIARADSVTIDPHKLGYVPYSAGVFLVKNQRNYDLKEISAPYIHYEGNDRGKSTLEGSRPATGAAALWMMAKSMPLTADGFGRVIARNFQGKVLLSSELKNIKVPVRIIETTENNILCFVVANQGDPISKVNERSLGIYEKFKGSDSRFMVSKTTINWQHYGLLCERFAGQWEAHCDTGEIVLIRMCLMNPFFTSSEMSVDFPKQFAHELDVMLNLNH